MTEMGEKAKLALRITSNALDDEIEDMVEEARDDMRRLGISEAAFDTPLARRAVIAYCKSQYAPDLAAAENLREVFRVTLDEMRRSAAYVGGDSG